MSNESPTFTRRGVVRTAAWSVPAVTVATAAPAYAASRATGTFAIDNTTLRPAWSGTRSPFDPLDPLGNDSGWFRIQNLAITNNGPDDLPNGALQITITFPSAWGTITRYSPDRPWPAGYEWSSEDNILTILAGPTVGAIPAGGVLNIADLAGAGGDGDDLWFDTSSNSAGLGVNNMIVSVDDYGTSSNFTGASRAASVATLGVARVWSTAS